MRSDKTDFILKTQRVKTMASTHVSRPTNLEGSFKGHTSKSTHSVSDNVKSPLVFLDLYSNSSIKGISSIIRF